MDRNFEQLDGLEVVLGRSPICSKNINRLKVATPMIPFSEEGLTAISPHVQLTGTIE